MEEHVKAVNAFVDDASAIFGAGIEDEEWGGIEDVETATPQVEPVDYEEEYIDEDKYTTVTVEAVDISKEGIKSSRDDEEDGVDEVEGKVTKQDTVEHKDKKGKKVWPKKEAKKKFRYESKTERKATRMKQRQSKSKGYARKSDG